MVDHSTATAGTAVLDDKAVTGPAPDGTPPLRVVEVAGCLLADAGTGTADRRAVALARQLPTEEGRVAVVVTYPGPLPVLALADALRRWVPLRWESVRLVAAYTAAGDPSPAKELADGLGVEVVAPDGPLVAVPDGSLFVAGGGEGATQGRARRGTWWRFRPGRDPEQLGRRHPAPTWERDLAGFTSPGIAGVVVDDIPAGLWLRSPGEIPLTDLAYAMPVHATAMALLVSRAGAPPLHPADVRRLVEALPAAVRTQLAVVPYGDQPLADSRLGAVASLAANMALRVRTGLPLRLTGGRGSQVVAVDGGGVPTWCPFVREQAWGPTGAARVLSWLPPAPQLLPVGPAQLALNERWLVEVVEAGLWIREADRLDGAATVRDLPLDSAHCSVVVGVFDDEQGQPPWRAIARLVQRMPADAQARLRLAVPQAAGERLLQSAVKASARSLDGRPVHLLADDGRFVAPQPARDNAAPDAPAPDNTAPDNTAPDNTAPDNTAPDNTAPDNTAPDAKACPDRANPDGTALNDTTRDRVVDHNPAKSVLPPAVAGGAGVGSSRTPWHPHLAGTRASAAAAPVPPGPPLARPESLPGLAPVVRVPDHVVTGHPSGGPSNGTPNGAMPSDGREEAR